MHEQFFVDSEAVCPFSVMPAMGRSPMSLLMLTLEARLVFEFANKEFNVFGLPTSMML